MATTGELKPVERIIALTILLLSSPAFACTNCLMTQVYFSSALTSLGAISLLNRYRQIQGWRAFFLGIGPIAIGTIAGMWSTLVFHLHYTLAPLAAVVATLTSVAILGRRCPPVSKEPTCPGFTPEA